ncbi:MAG: ABC transporter ATP-binding protein [Burkholderiaceae bacterium]|nr:ABC transporter ATP-binding protein [Burkholderiaceae bacterium]
MIATDKLDLRVGARALLNQLDWRIEAGQCWCVIGRNGAGKSTLLRTLAGLRAADAGAVKIGGRLLADWPLAQLARERAYLPQARGDAFSYSVLETVLAARHPYNDSRYWESDEDFRAANDALKTMDVQHLAKRDLRTLSGGERQRVAIAAVVAQDTPIMLLDEPANALDLAHQVGAMNLLAQLCETARKAIVLVSHDLNLAYAVATHALLLMDDGSWHAGAVDQVMLSPLLSECLGHPIETVQHGARPIFLPMS